MVVMLTRPARLCWPCRLAGPAHAAATARFSIQEGEIPRETDCLLEGDGFELLVQRHENFGFSAREASHIAFFGLLVVGDAAGYPR